MNPYRLVSRRLHFFERLTQLSYVQLFLLWIILNFSFTAMYFALSIVLPAHGPTIPAGLDMPARMFDSFYFSVVTATSTGYGDILPQGFSKVLAMMESVSALLVFAVLVGKLISQQQDKTLRQVHRMTFEGVFYHIRHVLFIVRKDLDSLIQKVKTHKQLTEQDWEDLSTAYLQAHSLVEEIPDLYAGREFALQNADLNREKLLFEAMHRTMHRIQDLLDTMHAAGIDWKSHEASTREFRLLIDTVDGIMPLWSERSPFHEEREFEDIRQLCAGLHESLKTAAEYAAHPRPTHSRRS